MAARSGNLFRPYAAGVSCPGSNSTRVMRPKISISAITRPAFVTASTTPQNLAKRVSSLGDENRSTRRELTFCFRLFQSRLFPCDECGQPGYHRTAYRLRRNRSLLQSRHVRYEFTNGKDTLAIALKLFLAVITKAANQSIASKFATSRTTSAFRNFPPSFRSLGAFNPGSHRYHAFDRHGGLWRCAVSSSH
jgi:hypothetical protein